MRDPRDPGTGSKVAWSITPTLASPSLQRDAEQKTRTLSPSGCSRWLITRAIRSHRPLTRLSDPGVPYPFWTRVASVTSARWDIKDGTYTLQLGGGRANSAAELANVTFKISILSNQLTLALVLRSIGHNCAFCIIFEYLKFNEIIFEFEFKKASASKELTRCNLFI